MPNLKNGMALRPRPDPRQLQKPGGRVRLGGDRGLAAEEVVGDQFGGPERGRDPQAFVAGGEDQPRVVGVRADDRQGVGGRGAEAGPGPDRGETGEARHVEQRPVDHPADHGRLDARVVNVVLPRRADQELARGPGLDVEGDRGGVGAVGALEITQFQELMRDESRMTVGDDQMALPRPDRQARRELGRAGTRGVDDEVGLDVRAVSQADPALANRLDRGVEPDPGSELRRLLDQPARRAGG